MISIFSVPKPFVGHIEVIQRNAIESWYRNEPEWVREIILLGSDKGTREVAKEFGCKYEPNIRYTESGAPLINTVFDQVIKRATFSYICYVNADIILPPNFSNVVAETREHISPALMAGRRWDLEVSDPIDFADAEWYEKLTMRANQEAVLHPASGIDYFAVPKFLFRSLPPYAIGRGVWDNALMFEAVARHAYLVDLTEVAPVIHQNHGYGHNNLNEHKVWQGVDYQRNYELAGKGRKILTLDHAYKAKKSGWRIEWTVRGFYFKVDVFLRRYRWAYIFHKPFKVCAKIVSRVVSLATLSVNCLLVVPALLLLLREYSRKTGLK